MRPSFQRLPMAATGSARMSLWERMLCSRLGSLEEGCLALSYAGTKRLFGVPGSGHPHARVEVSRPRFWRRVCASGTLGAAESYVDGDWETDNLTALVQLLIRNRSVLQRIDSSLGRVGERLAALYHASRRNTRAGSRRNIAAHYDLGNAFFERMLDETMTYSAAIFPNPRATLAQASVHKIDLLCRKLNLLPTDHLLEIGTGWGSLAVHAAREFGCKVTTTTISRQQFKESRRRIAAAGLSDRVRVLLCDYRDLSGRFDKIVSVEMIEAVGASYYPLFFRRCESLLEPKGRLLLQAITIADHLYDRSRGGVDFIKRHIFPGSCIPSVTALLTAATGSSRLGVRHLEDFSPHYARTLSAWRTNLQPHKAWVVRRYGESFWRMWMYYLCYCQAGFSERYIRSTHLLFDRQGETLQGSAWCSESK